MLCAQHVHKHLSAVRLLICVMLLFPAGFSFGQAGSIAAAPRITGAVDETNLVRLRGNTHPLALAKYDEGAVSDSLPIEHMYLELRRGPEQEAMSHQASPTAVLISTSGSISISM